MGIHSWATRVRKQPWSRARALLPGLALVLALPTSYRAAAAEEPAASHRPGPEATEPGVLEAGQGTGEGNAHELEDEQNAVLVIGAAAETGAAGGSGIYGGTIGLEYTLVEHWLEIEAGTAVLANSPRREIGADLAFKKPFRIGEHSELMLGAGPFVTRASDSDGTRMLHGWEVVADFQFWTSHTGGWYVEPVWSRATETRERTWGVAIGWLIGAHD